MRLVTNSVSPQQVRETDDAYIIEDVPFVRPMRLSGGYVPEENIKRTANRWNGKFATLNHTRNEEGEPIPADRQPDKHIGKIQDPYYDGTHVRGNVRIEKADLRELGGEAEDIEHALENGEQIHVSSQYAAKELAPGEYDGEYRENVERIIRPDSVAILPNKKGKCSIEDGCGINPEMVANAEVSITAMQESDLTDNKEVAGVVFEDTDTGELDESAIDPEETDLSDHYLYGDGEDKEDYSYPVVDAEGVLRRGNVDAAHQLGCRGQCPGDDEHTENLQALAQEFDTPPDWVDMEDNTLRSIGRSVLDSLGLSATEIEENSAATAGAESSEDDTEPEGGSDTTVNRDELKAEIIENSALTDESLSERCDDGLKAIHEDVMAANDTEETTMEEQEDAIVFESREDFENTVEEIVSNRLENSEKKDLAEEIVANSAEYEDTEKVLEDYPTTAALKDKQELLSDDTSVMPGTGMTPNAGSSDTDDFPDMEIGGEL